MSLVCLTIPDNTSTNPPANKGFLTNHFMSSFHTEIPSALRIPVKAINIHSHVPAMTHILLEQKEPLGSLENKSHSLLPWIAASLQLPGLCTAVSQRSSRPTGDNY